MKSKEKLKKRKYRVFQTMGNQTPESSVLRTYIETMFEVPWEEMSEDSTDLDHAQQILDRDHYGMEKVKERVLEYLAARAMSGKKDAAILCLVGLQGTGKTSIARSIAKATNKKYIRLSLGGVRDESEIRGHRKTYVGAMPGRIVEALKKEKETDGKPAVALELPNGKIVTGSTSDLLGAAAAALLNGIKALGEIEDDVKLIAKEAIEPIQILKTNYLGSKNPRLHTDEILIALSSTAAHNENAKKAMSQLT